MRPEQLQYLIEIDKHRSISAAARALYMGQTTLSAIVKALEGELGFLIFQRTYDGVEPTPEGMQVIAIAKEISARYEEIKQLKHQPLLISPPVTVLSAPTIGCFLSPLLSAAFLEQDPQGSLEFIELDGTKIGPRIIRNECDIGITYFREDELVDFISTAAKYQVKIQVLGRDHLYLLVRNDHPLACRDSVSTEELSDIEFASLPHFRTATTSIAYEAHLGYDNRYTTFSNVPLLKRAVLSQNMVAILSGYAIHYDHSVVSDGMRPIYLTDKNRENCMECCLLHRSTHNLRHQEKTLLRCVKECFSALPPPPFSPEARQEQHE